jgi:hypothetical protein
MRVEGGLLNATFWLLFAHVGDLATAPSAGGDQALLAQEGRPSALAPTISRRGYRKGTNQPGDTHSTLKVGPS